MKYVYEGVELKATLERISTNTWGRGRTVRKSSRSRELTFAVLADPFFCHVDLRLMEGEYPYPLNRPPTFNFAGGNRKG